MTGRVYFIQAENGGPVKIGWALDPDRRIREIQTGNHFPLVVRGHIAGGRDLERALHIKYADQRIRGEWFQPVPSMREQAPVEIGEATLVSSGGWTFGDRHGVLIENAQLELYWEVRGDPISDDWLPDEIDARDLLRRWWNQVQGWEPTPGLAAAHTPIYWFVDVHSPDRRTFEFAPGANHHASNPPSDFLTYFTWPYDPVTGDQVRWAELPVRDKLWNDTSCDKGGFIQEALGWKPSAYQESADFVMLARLAGIRL